MGEVLLQEATASLTAVSSGAAPLSAQTLSSWCAACRAVSHSTASFSEAHGLARFCASLLARADLCSHLATCFDGGVPMVMVVLHALSVGCVRAGPSAQQLALLGELAPLLCGAAWAAQYRACLEASAQPGAGADAGALQAPSALRARTLALLRDCLERCVGLPALRGGGGGGGGAARFSQACEALVPGMASVPWEAVGALLDGAAPPAAALSAALAAPATLPFASASAAQGLAALLACCRPGMPGAGTALDAALAHARRLADAAPDFALRAVWGGQEAGSAGAQLCHLLLDGLEAACQALLAKCTPPLPPSAAGGAPPEEPAPALCKRAQALLRKWEGLCDAFPAPMLGGAGGGGAAGGGEGHTAPLPPILRRFLRLAACLCGLPPALLPPHTLALPAYLAGLALGLTPRASAVPVQEAAAPAMLAAPLDAETAASLRCALARASEGLLPSAPPAELAGTLALQLALLSAAAAGSTGACQAFIHGVCGEEDGGFVPSLLALAARQAAPPRSADACGSETATLALLGGALRGALEGIARGPCAPTALHGAARHCAQGMAMHGAPLGSLCARLLAPPTPPHLHAALLEALGRAVLHCSPSHPHRQRAAAAALASALLLLPPATHAHTPGAAAACQALDTLLPLGSPGVSSTIITAMACEAEGAAQPPHPFSLTTLHARVLAHRREHSAACAVLRAVGKGVGGALLQRPPGSLSAAAHILDLPRRIATAASLALDVLAALAEVCEPAQGAAAGPHHHQQQQQATVSHYSAHVPLLLAAMQLLASASVSAVGLVVAGRGVGGGGGAGGAGAARAAPLPAECLEPFSRGRRVVLPLFMHAHLLHCHTVVTREGSSSSSSSGGGGGGGGGTHSTLASALHRAGALSAFVACFHECARALLVLAPLGKEEASRDLQGPATASAFHHRAGEGAAFFTFCLNLARQCFALEDAGAARWGDGADACAAMYVGAAWQECVGAPPGSEGASVAGAAGEAMGAVLQMALRSGSGGGRARARGLEACAAAAFRAGAGSGAGAGDGAAAQALLGKVLAALGVKAGEHAGRSFLGDCLPVLRALC